MFLVTGGAGFIGINVVRYLISSKENVIVFDNFYTGSRENLKGLDSYDNFGFFEGDLRNLAEIKQAVKDVKYILHQAAIPSVQRSVERPAISNDSNTNDQNILNNV